MPEPAEKIDFRRNPDEFESLYANNVQFETSAWDLKLIFGQLDQSQGPSVVQQHTAITVSWPEAKILAYFLLVNIVNHQAMYGAIQVPDFVLPHRPDPSAPGLDVNARKTIEYAAWIHDQFFSDHPYVPGGPEAPSPSE